MYRHVCGHVYRYEYRYAYRGGDTLLWKALIEEGFDTEMAEAIAIVL